MLHLTKIKKNIFGVYFTCYLNLCCYLNIDYVEFLKSLQMKLRKISKDDVSHLRFKVQFDFDLKAFRMDEYSSGLSLIVPFCFPFMDSDSCERPPFGCYDLLEEGYNFSHAVFHRFADGRLDVEYVYTLDLPDQDEDNIFVPSVSRLVLEKDLQSVNFQGYYKKVLQVLRMIQRYE